MGTPRLTDQFDRLQAWLGGLPGAPRWGAVRLVEAASIRRGPCDTAPRAALVDVDAYAERFEALLGAGYAWVNLSALGVEEGVLLVCIQLPSTPVGVPRGGTSVNFSGPPLDMGRGVTCWQVGHRVRVVG